MKTVWFLLLLRLFVSLYAPCYVHPDEFFQSIEQVAFKELNLVPSLRFFPMEFELFQPKFNSVVELPIRSVVSM